jgi:hypothetical protein
MTHHNGCNVLLLFLLSTSVIGCQDNSDLREGRAASLTLRRFKSIVHKEPETLTIKETTSFEMSENVLSSSTASHTELKIKGIVDNLL